MIHRLFKTQEIKFLLMVAQVSVGFPNGYCSDTAYILHHLQGMEGLTMFF
jgi:hypothetical protein